MPTATQAHRPIAIETPAGADALLLESFSFTDQLGRPFQIDAIVRSEADSVDPATLIGQNITIRLDLDDQGSGSRYLNGYISRFSMSGSSGGVAAYTMTITPFLSLLGRAADCRCYQNKSVPDIVQDLAKERGFTDITLSLSEAYPTREFCVQYRETVLNFVSRLMQEEGIYVFFNHEQGKHSCVLADNRSAHTSVGTIPFGKITEDAKSITIDHWTLDQEARSGGYTLVDYNYLTPKALLTSTISSPKGHAQADHELVDYPGGFTAKSEGDRLVKIRLEEAQARYEVAHGTTNSLELQAGSIFTLSDHPVASQNQDWLVTSVALHASTAGYDGTATSGGETHFSCSFTAIPAATPFRPARTAPEPVIIGPQPAVIVGQAGEEIYTDQYGRVKVVFLWDRYAKADENASIWIRVAQVAAGKNYGSVFLPRVGQEVLVEFSDGDPDRPVVTGVVYNGNNMPPYQLPDHKTRTVLLRSNTSKGGGGANELFFEDEANNEQIYLSAQKDYFDRIKNDRKEFIGKNRHVMIKGDQKESVDGDKHLTITGDHNEKINGTYSRTVQMDDQQKVQMNYGLDAGSNVYIKGGSNVVIEAGSELSLVVGGNFITIDSSGVSIVGSMVNINSGGSAGSGTEPSPETPAKPDEVDKPAYGATEDVPQDRTFTNSGAKSSQTVIPRAASPAAQVLDQAAAAGLPFCQKCADAAKAALAAAGQPMK